MAKKSKSIVLGTLFVVIVLAIVAYFVMKPHEKLPPVVNIDTKNQPTLGKKDATIHIVAFEDLKCGNCKIYNNTLFPKIKRQLIDTGKAKYTLINLAFIPGSMPAANAAHCLYEQKPAYFFNFVEHVYLNQPPEDQDWATTSRLLQFAKASNPNANLTALSQCMVEGRYNNSIQENLHIASKAMGNQVATPTLFVNGRRVSPLSMNQIKQLAGLTK